MWARLQHVGSGLLDEKQRLCKEAILWKHMSCRYILKFDGVFYHEDVPAIVTPWMPHGSITDYLEKHPDARRLPLVNLHVTPAPGIHSLRTLSTCSF